MVTRLVEKGLKTMRKTRGVVDKPSAFGKRERSTLKEVIGEEQGDDMLVKANQGGIISRTARPAKRCYERDFFFLKIWYGKIQS
jgi:hypothetical protein